MSDLCHFYKLTASGDAECEGDGDSLILAKYAMQAIAAKDSDHA